MKYLFGTILVLAFIGVLVDMDSATVLLMIGVGMVGLMNCTIDEINEKLDRLLAQNPPNGGQTEGG